MLKTEELSEWRTYLNNFNRCNRWRPTSLSVFGDNKCDNDQRGMPLIGISVEADREGSRRIHIMVGDHDPVDPRHHTFTVTDVKRLSDTSGADGRVDCMEIEDKHGVVNHLRFEPSSALPISR